MPDRLAGITDPRQRQHLLDCGWMKPEMCGCRLREDGTPWYKCHRKACDAEAQVCGGYCRPCFDRIMSTAGKRPPVVVLCGSTKFKAEFERETLRLAREGVIVLTVSAFGHSGDLPPEECIDGHPVKTALDELHKRKIDMAGRVFVINPGGYIGTSTRSEIEYAEWFEKPVDYLVEP